eukprot:8839174-Heterocapsa_arctica.AAC.1
MELTCKCKQNNTNNEKPKPKPKAKPKALTSQDYDELLKKKKIKDAKIADAKFMKSRQHNSTKPLNITPRPGTFRGVKP